MSQVETITLAPGYTVSRIAKGNWQLAERHGAAYDLDDAVEDMRRFVEAGINAFDCADHYVGVEELIGRFRARHPALARDVRISTKYTPDLELLPALTRRAKPRRECTLAFDCLATCGLRDGIAQFGQFCIDLQLAAALKGDVQRGLFFRGAGVLPFGSQIRPVRELLNYLLTGTAPAAA